MAGLVRAVRIVIGLALLFVFLSYQSETTTTGDETRHESQVGAWFSPWIKWTEVIRATKTATPEGGSIESRSTQTTSTFTMTSWSWPVLGAALFVLFWPRRRKPPADGARPAPGRPPGASV